MSKIKAAIYSRFSSGKQEDGYSIEAQVSICSDFCIDKNIEVVKVYEERARTGTNFNRPQFQQMMHDAEEGLFSVIVCHKVDRFGRFAVEALNYVERLRQLDVTLNFVYENLDTANDKDYCEFVRKCADAELFSKNLASESAKSLVIRAREGLYNGGTVSLGFKIDAVGHYVRDDMTAPIIEKIFDLYLDGVTISQIVDRINAEGYRSRKGNKFTKNLIYSVLRNERYCGVYTYSKSAGNDRFTGKRNSHKVKDSYIRLPGMCDVIIPPEKFALVQAKLNSKVKPTSYTCKHDYHYNGLMKASCGHRMAGTVNATHGRTYVKYVPTCKCKTCSAVNLSKLDDMMSYIFGEVLFDEENGKRVIELLNDYSEKMLPERAFKYEALSTERKDLADRRDKLVEVLEQSGMSHSEAIIERLNGIEARLKEIDAIIDLEPVKKGLSLTESDLPLLKMKFRRAYCNDKQLPEKSDFIKAAVKKIIVSGSSISVDFNGGIAVTPDTKRLLLSA